MFPSRTSPALALLAVLAGLTLTACSSTGAPGGMVTFPAHRAHPGFDTRDYPGDAAMVEWRDSSPYQWVGYYLPAPCYTGTSWNGRRQTLREMGWGMAVLFVGEQDWAAMTTARDVAQPEGGEGVRCTRSNLTTRQGANDAMEAMLEASSHGFPSGTVIYLDVERVEFVSAELARYVRAWVGAMLDEGRYLPGLYAHARNVPELHPLVVGEYGRRGRGRDVPLWVATSQGFDIARIPAESGFDAADVWQGAFNRNETWGGVTLRVDVNVARTPSPSESF